MAEELESLLQRIQDEGVKEADAEKEKIIASAREEAEKIVSDAREKADKTVKDAQNEAELYRQKAQESLQQAARDVLLSLRSRLQDQMADVVRSTTSEKVDDESVAGMIEEIVKAYSAQLGEVEQLEVLLPKDRLEAMEKVFNAKLGEDLYEKSELQAIADLEGGFQLKFNNEDVVYDFSDEALAEAICTYLNPRLAELVKSTLSDEEKEQKKE